MRLINGFLLLAPAAALVACATPAEAPKPVAAQPVPANPAAASAAKTFHAPFGYEKVALRDGTVRYCRNDLDADSRINRHARQRNGALIPH